MMRQYHAAQTRQGGNNPLGIGVIAVGNSFYLQDDGYLRHHNIMSPIMRAPWMVESFPNGQYHAARRNRQTGHWESIYAANRTDAAILRCLRSGRRKLVSINTLLFHRELGLDKPDNRYPDIPAWNLN